MNVKESALRVSWPGDLEGNKDWLAGLQRANKVLEEELGKSAGFVTADWKLLGGGNRTVFELSLTDLFTKSQVIEKFAPEEFHNEIQLGRRVHRMWGRLLQARSEGQIKKLEELANLEEGV